VPHAFRVGNKAVARGFYSEIREPIMRPEREFLLEQATACRQLALISNGEDGARLRKLADEYDTAAQTARIHRRKALDPDTFKQTEEPWKGNPESEQPQGTKHDLEKWNRTSTH